MVIRTVRRYGLDALCDSAERGIGRPIASLLTQVVVDADDPAFARPTKPIGVFYDRRQAEELSRRGFHVMEDAGRSFRRVVPSPRPLEIIEADVIRQLLALGVIVIAAGGGGIPVVRREGKLSGVEAVVDKDLTAACDTHLQRHGIRLAERFLDARQKVSHLWTVAVGDEQLGVAS